jgi:eukaryotic-like serine/threonine-protein kinase
MCDASCRVGDRSHDDTELPASGSLVTLVPDGVPPRGDQPEGSLRRGSTLGRYVVIERLGAGGMGVVYAAYDPSLDRKVALKLLRFGSSSDSTAGRARLLREAQAIARLSHPNVVTVHDVGMLDDRVFVAMEFVDGLTLGGWLEETARSWREILEVFAQASRGLAAAHAAGLVHRDFKPDNVMLGRDGRVRVMDFGLARPAGDGATAQGGGSATGDASGTDADASGSLLACSMTATGAIMGTPAYMAPEQHRGHDTDARTDQFSFCVALYEALYRHKPFAGSSLPSLMVRVLEGNVREPGRARDVPGYLWPVIRRGLSVEPERRFPDMASLLRALERDPRAAWRRWVLAGSAAIAVSIGVWMQVAPGDDPCPADAAWLAGVWDDERRAGVRRAFSEAAPTLADEAFGRVSDRFDALADELAALQHAACVETRVRHKQSEALFERQTTCLERREAEALAVVETFLAADTDTVVHAAEAVRRLTPATDCADADALRRELDMPTDPSIRAGIEAQELRLAEVRGLTAAGRYIDALALAREIDGEARPLGWGPLIARARYQVGKLENQLDENEAAAETLREALHWAVTGREDALVPQVLGSVGTVVGYELGRFEEGLAWLDHAEAWLERIEAEPGDHYVVLTGRGVVLRDQGRLGEALELFEQALGLVDDDLPQARLVESNIGETLRRMGEYERALDVYARSLDKARELTGPRHPAVATLLNNMAAVHQELGQSAQAFELLRQALELRTEAFGRQHPTVVATLANLGRNESDVGRHEEALELLGEALELQLTTGGRTQIMTSNILNNLGVAHAGLRNFGEAIDFYEQALEVKEHLHGKEHPELAAALMNLGNAYGDDGRYELALEHVRRAVEHGEAGLAHDHPNLAVMRTSLGIALARVGRLEEARVAHEASLAVLERKLGPDHPVIFHPLYGLGTALLDLGREQEAAEPFRRASALSHGVDPVDRAHAQFGLARALWKTGARVEARESAHRAERAFADAGATSHAQRVLAWLARPR